MDKISKLLSKISAKDREKIALSIEMIVDNGSAKLDIMKLRGQDNIFRVRVGEYRVIYKKLGGVVMILEISKRNDNTYKKY